MSARVLEVTALKTYFFGAAGEARAVNDVSLYVDAGEVLALVGESGSGKSMTGYSLLGLVDPPGKIIGGTIVLNGENLSGLSQAAWRKIRGNRIAMIFQDPMMTLNPVLSIETQMVEEVLAHQSVSKSAARACALEALERVGIPGAKQRLRDYPHQFSGGMRQRVSIAIALLNRPDLIICDEPTTALDVTIQAQIIAEMQQLCIEAGTALIWITHDLSIVAGLADRVAVMYAGRIVETGTTSEVIEAPRHPYTRGLIDSTPAAARSRMGAGKHLVPIPGFTPSPVDLPAGCAFHARCSHATDICLTEPRETREGPTRMYRCFHPLETEVTLAADAGSNASGESV